MAGRLVAVTLALLPLLLAGCGSKAAGTDTAPPGPEVHATPTTGVIRGIVVDDAIRPLAGATVKESPGNRTTTSDAKGGFGFENLSPGVHFLTASKLGYTSVQQSAQVVAGVDDPTPLRIQIAQLASSKPYHDLVKFRGNQAFAITGYIPPTGVLNERPRFVSAVPGVFNGSYEFTTTYSPNPAWEQTIMVWDAKTPAATQLQIDQCVYVAAGACDNKGARFEDSVWGASPIVLTANATFQKVLAAGQPLVDDVVVWAGGTTGTMPDVGTTLDQDFELIQLHTYNWVPAEGYRFDKDGEPTDPAA